MPSVIGASEMIGAEKKSAKDLHAKAEEAREKDNHIAALKYLDEAIPLYQKEKDYEGICSALQSRVLTLKHLFLTTKDEVFAIMAKKEAEAALEVAQKHNLSGKFSSCYFRLGEILMLFGNSSQAIDWYKKALDAYQGSLAEKGDYRYHHGEALYRNGQKEEGKKTIFEGLKEIQEGRGEVDPFLANVWESGLYMRLADLLREDEPDEAKSYLEAAQKIAQSDERLVIRRRQIGELAKTF